MRKEEAKFETKFISNLGTQEKNNDYFGYVQLDNYAIWVTADGFDEEEGADIAARIAVEAAVEYFMLTPGFNTKVLKEVVEYAHSKVVEKQEENERFSLMHTSLLIVISNYHSILWANVGNTRLYHLRDGFIHYQSKDDTIAQLLVNDEVLDIKDIKQHRQRKDLTQAIGDYIKIKPNISKNPIPLQEGDILFLCTIGAWENLDESEIEVELSKVEDRKQWLKSLENKIMATSRKEVDNYTIASVVVEKTASPEKIKKSRKPLIIKIIIIAVILFIVILSLSLWNMKKRNDTIKTAQTYQKQAEESIIKKDFNNSVDDFNLAVGEYDKLHIKSRGIIGFFRGAKGKNKNTDEKIKEVKDKIEITEKLKKAFQDINEGNQLFNAGDYDQASRKYQAAKFTLEQNTYKRDELNTDEILVILNTRIDAVPKLMEAKSLEKTGDEAIARSDFGTAKSKYDDVINIYLTNGKADYVINLERKIEDISEQQQTAYNGALLTENKADMLSSSNPNSARETYYSARSMYQLLGDKVKASEIDNKIQEINARQIADLQTANNLVQEGLGLISSGTPALAIANFNKAKGMYEKLGDTKNSRSTDEYLKQAQTFIKVEDNTKQIIVEKDTEIAARNAQIEAERKKVDDERKRIEEINNKISQAIDLESKGDELAFSERYIESIEKYENAKKLYVEVGQTAKIEYLDFKIKRNEGFLYELQGDQSYKAKKWKDAEQKYKMSKDSFDKSGDVKEEINTRIEKKLAKATKKANKKWWQFWK